MVTVATPLIGYFSWGIWGAIVGGVVVILYIATLQDKRYDIVFYKNALEWRHFHRELSVEANLGLKVRYIVKEPSSHFTDVSDGIPDVGYGSIKVLFDDNWSFISLHSITLNAFGTWLPGFENDLLHFRGMIIWPTNRLILSLFCAYRVITSG